MKQLSLSFYKHWLVKKGSGRIFGPVSLQELRQWVWETRVIGEDLVSPDGGKTWVKAEEVRELIPFFHPGLAKVEETPKGHIIGVQRRRRKSIGPIDLVPLIDVVFLLLIFLMLTATFTVQSGIKVSLPQAASAEEEIEKKFTVYLTTDGLLYLNEEEIDLETLPQRLKDLMRAEGNVLIIKADKTTAHGKVVRVLDIACSAGVDRLVIAVEREEK
ncbi:biopolymer transporter ExbD [bacterium]|nr:biopolymer transporter ExbD [bacterium]